MKKTTKIIVSLGAILLVAAVVLVISIVKSDGFGKEETSAPLYTLQTTKKPSTTGVTESWVDLDQMASELATATDTTGPSDTTTDTTTAPVIQTPIVYVIYSQTEVANQTAENKNDDVEPEMVEYKYTLDKKTRTATVNKYLGDDSIVWIPEKISGYTVTAIGSKCFEKNSLKGVVIPEEVVSIGNNAFRDCKNLASVTFEGAPSTVTVGDMAFQNCTRLETINLPAAETIGRLAFDNCTSLEKMSIKSGTKEIGDYCFRGCTALKRIEIPKTVTVIGQGAFSGDYRDDFVICCVQGSAADECAQRYGFKTDYVP